MKLERDEATGELVLTLRPQERDLVRQTLELYPLVPATHHKLSRGENSSEENQRLLDEALAEQRAENRKQLDALIAAPKRWQRAGKSFRVRIAPDEIDWLLQILNDVRVGCWLQLGAPEEDRTPEISAENFRFAVAMDLCGMLQSALLAGVGETESPDWLG